MAVRKKSGRKPRTPKPQPIAAVIEVEDTPSPMTIKQIIDSLEHEFVTAVDALRARFDSILETIK